MERILKSIKEVYDGYEVYSLNGTIESNLGNEPTVIVNNEISLEDKMVVLENTLSDVLAMSQTEFLSNGLFEKVVFPFV